MRSKHGHEAEQTTTIHVREMCMHSVAPHRCQAPARNRIGLIVANVA